MRIDSSGNLLVGKTAKNTDVAGSELRSDGAIYGTRDSNFHMLLNRLTNDGDIISFSKDGATVGNIGAKLASGQSRLYLGNSNTKLLFDNGADRIYPVNNDGNARNAAIDLGLSGATFKDLYLSGGVYLGGTGSANKLDEYEEGNWTCVLRPSSGFTATSNSVTGKYVKVGDLVWVTANPTMATPASLGSYSPNNINYALKVEGLPYNVGGYGVQGRSAPVIGVAQNIGYSSGDTLAGHGSEGTDSISIFCNRPNGATRRSPTLYASASANFHLSFTYRI